jgi:hypothetical protein
MEAASPISGRIAALSGAAPLLRALRCLFRAFKTLIFNQYLPNNLGMLIIPLGFLVILLTEFAG